MKNKTKRNPLKWYVLSVDIARCTKEAWVLLKDKKIRITGLKRIDIRSKNYFYIAAKKMNGKLFRLKEGMKIITNITTDYYDHDDSYIPKVLVFDSSFLKSRTPDEKKFEHST